MVLLCFVMGRVAVLILCDLVLCAGQCCVVIIVLFVVVKSWSIVITIPGPQSRAGPGIILVSSVLANCDILRNCKSCCCAFGIGF